MARPKKQPIGEPTQMTEPSTNGATVTERMDRAMLTLQGMESVVAQREREIDDLNHKRSNLVGQISSLEKEFEQKKQHMSLEYQRKNQAFEASVGERMNDLSHREKAADRLAVQLDQREKDVASLESQFEMLAQKERELNEKAVSVERIRIQYQLDADRASNKLAEIDGIKAENELNHSENKRLEMELREKRDQLYGVEADLDKRLKAVITKEKSLEAISAGIGPKLAEIEERETTVFESLKEARLKIEENKALEAKMKEVESILDRKEKEATERMDFIQQQEALQKQKKMELLAWEDKLRLMEKKLVK